MAEPAPISAQSDDDTRDFLPPDFASTLPPRQQLAERVLGRGNQLYLCHDNCGGYDPNNWSRTIKGMFLTRFGANTGLRTFTQALTEIVRFLDERPEEIVTVFVEFGPVNSDLGDQRDAINRAFAAALRDSGADRQVYFPDLPTASIAGLDRTTVFHSVNGTIGGDFDWPLVRDMRQRLVLFIDRGDRAMGGGLLPFTWRFVREIDYGDRGTAPHNLIVAERAESERWRAGRTNFQERPLSRFNHFVYFALPASAVDVHRQSNQRGWLLRRIIAYSRAGWTIPNFVAVDSIATGDAAEVVRAIDGCWRAADRAQCVQALTLARAPLSDAMRTDTVAPANMTIDGGELK